MKRYTIVLAIVIVSLLSVGLVAAQGPDGEDRGRRPGGDRPHSFMPLVSEALGIEVDVLREALQEEGATWASVIEANGGDVEAIKALIVADIVEKTGEDATEVEARVDEALNSPLPERPEDGRRGGFPFFDLISEELGVEVDVLREALQEEGATWASVIEANGGDVEVIKALIVAEIVEKTGDDASEVEARVDEMLNSPLPERPEGGRDGGRRGPGGPGDEGGPLT